MKTKLYFIVFMLCPVLLLGQENSWDGQGISPNSHFRALNIFINVIYDVNPDLDPCKDTINQCWVTALEEGVNNDAIPPYLLGFMDTTYNHNNLRGSSTRRFGEASFGNLKIIGDFVVVNIKESTVIGSNTTFHYTNIFEKAIDLINVNGLETVYGHNSISDYDFSNNGTFYYTQIAYRNLTEDYGGYKAGQGSGNLGILSSCRIRIGNKYYPLNKGTTQCIGAGNLAGGDMLVMDHELGHDLFGSNAFHTSGGNHLGTREYMPFLSVQHGHGLMSGAAVCLSSCNGYDRLRMHWKHPNSVDYIAARDANNSSSVVSDIKKEDGDKTFVLRDFVTYGDVVRIKLPYKDSDAASNQYIWLENHQVGRNDKWDFLQYANLSECREMEGKPGIYAYYQVGRDVLSGSRDDVWYSNERDNLRMIPAEGYWDYRTVFDRYQTECVNYDWHESYGVREEPNPFCGSHDQEKQFHTKPGIDILRSAESDNLWRKVIGNDTIQNLVFLGDNNDAFYKRTKIGMSTNPSTCNAKTYYSFIKINKNAPDTYGYTAESHRNNQTTYLTGLSIEMIPQSDSSTFVVKVRWDDYDINNSANWTGKVSLQEKAILKSGNSITLKQNKTVSQFTRDQSTGYFAKRSIFECEDGSEFIQERQTTFNVEDGSTFVLKSGSTYTISDEAIVNINSGCKIKVESCAHLIIKGSGKLNIKSGAIYEFEPGALVSIDNGENISLPNDLSTLESTIGGGETHHPNPNASWLFSTLNLWYGNTITANTTISSNLTVTNPIEIEPGVTLTINGNLSFLPNSSIIVKNGAKLVVNNSTLTNHSCKTGMWKGIEVWGNTHLAQSGTNYGLVTLNNATIENAETGVILAKRYSPTQGTLDPDTGISSGIKGTIGGAVKPIKPPVIDVNYSGGKIAATNSRFINNKSCVEFYLYTKKNSSYFHSCDFEMSNNIAGASNLVYINSTNGVTFEDCDFKFSAGGTSSSLKGIYASNSSFYVYPKCTHSNIMHVTPYCSNPTLENYSTFENLAYGIYAVGNSGTLPYSVKFTKFDGNSRGIYNSGIYNVSITDCDFKVITPNYVVASDDPILIEEDYINYGLYFNGSTGYQIEDNTFSGLNRSGGLVMPGYLRGTYGIIINNSGGAANRIYRNNLSSLEVGAQAQGNNRDASNGVGLCFTCNDFSYNKTDISVVANSVNDGNSVAEYQKNGNRPAANGFTWDSYQRHRWDFYNYTGGPEVNYHQFSENANGRKYILTQYTKDNVKAWSSDYAANAHEVECPRTPYNYRYNDVVDKQSLSEETKTKLDELVDGGNSSEMILAIGNATPLDANSLGEMLSNNSPYLSNESVKATVANEAAVDNVMLRDVLVGNSHAVRDEEIMRDVNERTNPLPAYMYEQIDIAAETISGLDLLKIELQETLADYTNAVTVVAQNSIVNDSIETWELLMSSALNEDLRYGYAVYNAIKGDLSTSSDVIDSMTDLNDVYIELLEVLSGTIESESSNEAAFSTLMSISEQDNRAGVLASTILSDLGYIDYQEPIYKIDDEDGFKHDAAKPERRVAESMTSNINLYPNPAKDYIVVEYNAEGLSDKLTMTISDMEGKMVYSKKLSYSKDSVKVDVKGLTNGNYILNICSEGNVVYSKKFVVNNK